MGAVRLNVYKDFFFGAIIGITSCVVFALLHSLVQRNCCMSCKNESDLSMTDTNRTLYANNTFQTAYMTRSMQNIFFIIVATASWFYFIYKNSLSTQNGTRRKSFFFIARNVLNSTQSIVPRILSTNALDSARLRPEWRTGISTILHATCSYYSISFVFLGSI